MVELDRYILEGGFRKALDCPKMVDERAYAGFIIREIFGRDIRWRVKAESVSVFNQVHDCAVNSFGATTPLTNILFDLNRQSVRIKRETLNRHLQIHEGVKIISKRMRFGMKSRKSLWGEQKCYLVDLSFCYCAERGQPHQLRAVLENIVYNYVWYLGYEVSKGRIGKFECDYVMRLHEMEYACARLAMTVTSDRTTEDRECRSSRYGTTGPSSSSRETILSSAAAASCTRTQRS